MKKTLSGIIILALLYCSCYKASNPPHPNGIPTFDIFIVDNANSPNRNTEGSIKDSVITASMPDSAVTYLGFDFSLISGFPESYPITCVIVGLPAGVIDSPESFTFKLSYQIIFKISVNADTGIYTAQLDVSAPTGQHSYPFRIHVTPPPAYSGYDSFYYGRDACTLMDVGYYTNISTAQNNGHQIDIDDLSGNWAVYANIIGSYPSATIKIPLQTTTGGAYIYGTGFSAPDTGANTNRKPMIYIADTIITAGDTQTCSVNLKAHSWQ